jgi:hypothetical protein
VTSWALTNHAGTCLEKIFLVPYECGSEKIKFLIRDCTDRSIPCLGFWVIRRFLNVIVTFETVTSWALTNHAGTRLLLFFSLPHECGSEKIRFLIRDSTDRSIPYIKNLIFSFSTWARLALCHIGQIHP